MGDDTEQTTPDVTNDVTDSDPSGNTPEGLAGGMGVSSERVESFQRRPGAGTHAAGRPHPNAPRDARDQALDVPPGAPPEQSPDPERGPEVNPDPPA